ncbi:MAG: radical SAM protein [Candidatus Omnitrophota bacterium]
MGLRKVKKLIKEYMPEIVGYSIMTGEHTRLLEINKTLKEEFNFLSVFGGSHATFFPDLIYEDGVDAICIGEGDIAFVEFCKRMSQRADFWKSPNFVVRHNGTVVKNELLPLIDRLDTLPFPDREIMYQADRSLYDEGHKMFFTSRGCPYLCTYCFNSKYNDLYKEKGAIMRYRSPENVVAEMRAVREKYPLDIIWVDDDNFLAQSKDWLVRFAKLYKERARKPLSINARANYVNEENVLLLKEAGLDSVWMGVECGNQEASDSVLKRNLTNEQILNAAHIIKRYGIKLITQNLIGLPLKNSYTVDLETLDMNIKIKPTFAWSSILYSYPGTPIESYARDNGFLSGKVQTLETNKRISAFNFPSKEKRKIGNLHKLFGLTVHFPFLRKYIDFLCLLPLNFLYLMLFYLWYGYNIKFRIYPFRSLRKEFFRYVSLWWRFILKT